MSCVTLHIHSMCDSEDDSCYGFLTHDFLLTCGEASPDSDFNTPRRGQASRFELFIDPQRNIPEHNILFSCNRAICDFIIPDILGTMFQFGSAPDGKGKHVTFKFQVFDVQINMLDALVQGFFYRCLRFIGFLELWGWKEEGRQAMLSQEKRHSEADLVPYYAQHRSLFNQLSSSSEKERSLAREQIIKLESDLPLISIMHLRRVSADWNFTTIEGACDPLLPYSSECDLQDVLMSRHLKRHRLNYERDAAYIHSFRVEPIAMNDYTVHFLNRDSEEVHSEYLPCPGLPSYPCSREFILNASYSEFRYFYRMQPAENESVEKKLSISLSLKKPLLVDDRHRSPSDTVIGSHKRGDDSENLNFEYWYCGTGGFCVHAGLSSIVYPLETTSQLIQFLKLLCTCLTRENSAKEQKSGSSNHQLKELYFGGQCLNAVIVLKNIFLVMRTGNHHMTSSDILSSRLTGSLVLHSNASSETFSLQIAEWVVWRKTISSHLCKALDYDAPTVNWVALTSAETSVSSTLLDLTLMTLAFENEVRDRVGADVNFSWKEIDMIERAGRENLQRICLSITRIKLKEKYRSMAADDEVLIRVCVDGREEEIEAHRARIQFPEMVEFEFLVPTVLSGHQLKISIFGDSGRVIGDAELLLAAKIHRGSLFAYNGDSVVCLMEFKADVCLPLMFICLSDMRLHHPYLSDQGNEESERTMHFLISVPLPPDCSTSILLASSSIIAKESSALRERFLVPCYPGKYFPVAISMHLEGEHNDVLMGSGSIAIGGMPSSGLAKLKDGVADIAEVSYSYAWYDETLLDSRLEGASLAEAEGTEELSVTNDGGVDVAIVDSGRVIFRRVKREVFVELEDLSCSLNNEDLQLILRWKELLSTIFPLKHCRSEDEIISPNAFPDGGLPQEIAGGEPKTEALPLRSESAVRGTLIARCMDYVWESPILKELTFPYVTLGEVMANSSPRRAYNHLWAFLELHEILSPRMDIAALDAVSLFNIQIKLVECLGNYAFAKSLWGLFIVPYFSGAPRIGAKRLLAY